MPQYLAPGVYVEEVDTGIRTIEGVSTSVAGMVGATRRGPKRGLPQLVTSFAEFERIYGGFFPPGSTLSGALPLAVYGFFLNGGRQLYVSGVATPGASAASKQAKGPMIGSSQANSATFNAKETGAWGKEIAITGTPRFGPKAKVSSVHVANKEITINGNATGFYTNAWIRMPMDKFAKVMGVLSSGASSVLTVDALGTTDVAANDDIEVAEFDLTVTHGNTVEEYTGLTLENIPGKSINDRLQGSALIALASTTLPGTGPANFPHGTFNLTDAGLDGTGPVDNDYIGSPSDLPGDRTGIKALEDIDGISIIAAPGNTTNSVQAALIAQCEILKDRFAVLDSPATATVASIQTHRNQFDTRYAAIYFPSLRINDPVTGNVIDCPPSGHMAGIYARVDTERGVHKAPANEIVRGAVDFTLRVNKETQDVLNPENINVFRDFRADGRGLRIWGARVMTSDTQWKYINVRRLFLFLEESIDEGTQWVVFEPNDEPLWARVRQSISAFLTRVWRDGALMGATAEEAFFVKCDRTTMTQDDIDNGRLIVLVGVAPVKPAEFVIIRISQWTAGAAEA